MDWIFKTFANLNQDELYEILRLRVDVFVVEQVCPYPELDGKDKDLKTIHLMAKDGQGMLLAYLRILPPGLSFPDASLGRVVVEKKERRKGICKLMIQKALEKIVQKWPGQDVRISAQVYLTEFYESLEFKTVTKSYLEDGILHIDMVKYCS